MDYLYALQCIREATPQWINSLFVFFSEQMIVLAFLLPLIIYWSINKAEGLIILFGFGTAININQTLKNIACIYRPWILDNRLHLDPHAVSSATGYSFPSGHTTIASSAYGGVSVYQRKRTSIIILMSLFIVLTAFARNWLGAHTMKDVVVAILISCASIILVHIIRFWFSKHQKYDTAIMIGGISLVILSLIYTTFKSYPMDFLPDGSILVDPYAMQTDCFSFAGIYTGMLLGWWLERRFVRFAVSDSKKENIIRSVIGCAVFGLLYAFAGKLFAFAGNHIAHFIKYFVIYLISIFVYPLIFSKIKRD